MKVNLKFYSASSQRKAKKKDQKNFKLVAKIKCSPSKPFGHQELKSFAGIKIGINIQDGKFKKLLER